MKRVIPALLIFILVLSAGCDNKHKYPWKFQTPKQGDEGSSSPSIPVFNVYVNVKLESSAENASFKSNPVALQIATPLVNDSALDAFSTGDCTTRSIGEFIIRHKKGGLVDKKLSVLADDENLIVIKDVLNGKERGDKFIYTLVRLKPVLREYLAKCSENSVITAAALKPLVRKELSSLKKLRDILKSAGEENTTSILPNYKRSFQTDGSVENAETNTHRDWNLKAINAYFAWKLYEENPEKFKKVTVAVIDTGIDANHSDLSYALENGLGYDFISSESMEGYEVYDSSRPGDTAKDLFGEDDRGNDPNPFDNGDDFSTPSFHGTHVAGIIAADTGHPDDNGYDVKGVAKNVVLFPIRVLGVGGGTDVDVARAVLYAAGFEVKDSHGEKVKAKRKADIINMSLGGASPNQMLHDAIRKAYEAGVLIIAAAGNSGTALRSYPASYPEVIGVGAVAPPIDGKYGLASYSNYGPNTDVVAPGGGGSVNQGIYSTWVAFMTGIKKGDDVTQYYWDDYAMMSGTSMASPHVAGAAAMLMGYQLKNGEYLNNRQTRALLINTSSYEKLADSSDPKQEYGFGMIDLKKAFSMIENVEDMSGTTIKITLQKDGTALVKKVSADYGWQIVFEGVTAGTYEFSAVGDTDGDGEYDITYKVCPKKLTVKKDTKTTLILR